MSLTCSIGFYANKNEYKQTKLDLRKKFFFSINLKTGDNMVNMQIKIFPAPRFVCNKKSLKFGLSEKHTKVCAIFLMLWTFTK